MRSTTIDLVFFTLLAAGLVYFSIDAWVGESGGVNIAPLERRIDRLENDIAEMSAAKEALATRNAGLKGSEIDQDLLDERLRAAFGVGDPDDALIIVPD